MTWLGAITTSRYVELGFVGPQEIRAPDLTRASRAEVTAALFISEGGNPMHVKRRMGHEDIRTTYNVYGHLFDDDEDALVERLDRRA